MNNQWNGAINSIVNEYDNLSSADVKQQCRLIEQDKGVILPESFKAVMAKAQLNSDMQSKIFPGFDVLPIDQVISLLEIWVNFIDDEEMDDEISGFFDGRIKKYIFDKKRIPFATSNGDVFLCLDFDPSSLGEMGQIIQLYPEAISCHWIAPSFDQLIIDMANGKVLDPDLGCED